MKFADAIWRYRMRRWCIGAWIVVASVPAFGQDRYAREPFDLGPVKPTLDLRNMLREHLVRRSCELLDAGAVRRKEAR